MELLNKVPCKQCIIQPICSKPCDYLSKYGTNVIAEKNVEARYSPESKHYEREYQEFKRYFKLIYRRYRRRYNEI